ncbi:hypothetical protein [Thioalkalivibrio sp. HK1]|uniref:hypothetical protein n=1 Tax=Thioalkalivibrio sp. HK1 TaxID=1469245 RepID=UPI00046E6FE1|nr:hypothetical protein [Thioalkalivibrio sp. HK1]
MIVFLIELVSHILGILGFFFAIYTFQKSKQKPSILDDFYLRRKEKALMAAFDLIKKEEFDVTQELFDKNNPKTYCITVYIDKKFKSTRFAYWKIRNIVSKINKIHSVKMKVRKDEANIVYVID